MSITLVNFSVRLFNHCFMNTDNYRSFFEQLQSSFEIICVNYKCSLLKGLKLVHIQQCISFVRYCTFVH